jgi:glutathionylspermidine synthase
VPVLARIDLAHTTDGLKLLEYNGEAPGLVVETFGLNALACAEARRCDVNASSPEVLAKALCAALHLGVEYVGGHADRAVIAFSYNLGSDRQSAAARYLAELAEDTLGIRPVDVPLESLRALRERLCLPDGRPLDVLWPSCPVHYLGAALSSPESTPDECAALIARLVRERQLAVVNAPDASLLSSKAAQAVIFGLAQQGLYFSEAEAEIVQTYFLPTFLDPPGEADTYVIKPAFGSEGDSITIVDSARLEVRRSACSSYRGEADVYQKYAALPTARLMTEYGAQDLRVVTSCFLVSGQPAGIILRAGEEITDDQAWVVPVSRATIG